MVGGWKIELKNFSRKELECPCCEKFGVDPKSGEKLQKLRDLAGPININSAFRCEKQNQKVRGAKNSFHVLGKAFDIKTSKMSTQEKEDLVTKAISLGFRGIGIYDKHIHIDDREKEARWVGKSS